MLAARRLQNSCPQCTAQILKLYVHSIAEISPATARTTRGSISRTRLRPRRNDARFMSTTPRKFRDEQTENPVEEAQPGQLPDELVEIPENELPPPDEDPEVLVRQAKRMFGDTLPEGYLSEAEYKLYKRLYGAPLRPTKPEDVGFGSFGEAEEADVGNALNNVLLRESEEGTLEEVEYTAQSVSTIIGDGEVVPTEEDLLIARPPSDAQLDYIEANARHEGPRLHQYTTEGQFRTSPRTLHLPRLDFVQPITELLRRTDTKHIRAAAEKNFGGPGLPHSPATPRSSRNIPQKGLGLEAGHHRMSEIDADAFIATALPGIYSSVMSTLVEVRKRLGPEWLRGLLKRKDADGEGPRVLDHGAGGAGLSAWQSVAQAEWDVLRDKGEVTGDQPAGKRTVVVGSNQLRHRLSDFLENTQFLPRLPNYVHSVDNTEKQLDAPEVPQKRKTYDVIIATHLLMPLDKEWRRREVLDNLWSMLSPNGGVLIMLEKGHPRGFEAVADVRDRLLNQFIIPPTAAPPAESTEQETGRVREPGMIVAPCTNHSKCPMYLAPGLSPGRKDFCHFTQRFIRPPFLQRILEAKHRNHEDINFSYIAVRRGMPASSSTSSTSAESSPATTEDNTDDVLNIKSIRQGREATDQAFAGYEGVDPDSPDRPHPLSLPRNILPPIKRHGHITLDLCTPAGTIERWTVPRSFSKQAYHDARKAQWGDLWALGAKTRVRRSVRLGKGIVEGVPIPQDGGVRATRAAMSGKKGRPKVVEMDYDSKGVLSGRRKGVVGQRPERRTKGGRIPPRERNVFKEVEDDLD
ncbi:37S ribosomal protein S22, mitochondrial [Cytospora mali]|uniref:37S ribosomal protein S22, mitochondrial n=1 Tax=Cytospora mali TaxID=578113 RepID=A0A194V585_CYTMA|nr:37S ribosomal protein S22, mitochondrial [Valsa mali var. pyri (nom. inval.)]